MDYDHLASLRRLYVSSLSLLVLSLVGLGGLLWYAIATHHDHAALLQALTVQTRALAERLR